MRLPGQRQQVSSQIDKKQRQIGTVYSKNTKYFSFTDRKDDQRQNEGDSSRQFKWRKTRFVKNQGQYFIPSIGSFIQYIIDDNGIPLLSYMDSTNGFLYDSNIEQYSNILYAIEIYRRNSSIVNIPLNAFGSTAVSVDGEIIYSSSSGPTISQTLSVHIPGNKWVKLFVFYYSSTTVDQNHIAFNIDLMQYTENNRVPTPSNIVSIVASQGTYTSHIKIDWSIDNPLEVAKFEIFSSTESNGEYTLLGVLEPFNPTFSHTIATSNLHYFYKVRAITSDGMTTDFSSTAEGWLRPIGIGGSSSLSFGYLPNERTELSGYYNQDDIVYLYLNSSRNVYNSTPSVKAMQESGSQYIVMTDCTFVSKENDSKWKYSFDPNTAGFSEGYINVFSMLSGDKLTGSQDYLINSGFSTTEELSVYDVITSFATSGNNYVAFANSGESIYGLSCQFTITGFFQTADSNLKSGKFVTYLGTISGANLVIEQKKESPFSILYNTGTIAFDRTFYFNDLNPDTLYGLASAAYIITGVGWGTTLITGAINEDESYISDTYAISGGFIIDNTAPSYGFILDGDGTFTQTQDIFVNSRDLFVITDSSVTNDSGTSVYPTSGGVSYVSNIYQARYTNATDKYLISGEDWVTYYGASTPLSFTLDTITGLRWVYGQVQDKSGNISLIASDSIYYTTGHIENITMVQTGYKSYYDFIPIRWQKPTRPDVNGYFVYRNENSITEPSSTAIPYHIITNPTVTSFNDIYVYGSTNLKQDTSYYYWTKAYTQIGELSSGFSTPIASGYLCDSPPSGDTFVSMSTGEDAFTIIFSGSNYNSPSGRRAAKHYIGRNDITAGDGLIYDAAKTKIIDVVYETDKSMVFRPFIFEDIPPSQIRIYKYMSIPENTFSYIATGAGLIAYSITGMISKGEPAKPTWVSGETIGLPWGILLVWNRPIQTNVNMYQIYRASGNWSASQFVNVPSAIVSTYNYPYTYDNYQNKIRYLDPRESLPYKDYSYTYWLKAFNSDGLNSAVSDSIVRSLATVPMTPPMWITAECTGDFGFIRLALSGYIESYGTLGGYKIYRNTTSDSATSTLITTLDDNRSYGAINYYNDTSVQPWKNYYYWAKSFSTYGSESNYSTALGPLFAEPNYGTLFSNYLDNSSFERVLNSDVNWASIPLTTGGSYSAQHGNVYTTIDASNSLIYSGYIFSQTNKRYQLSYYLRRHALGNGTANISGVIVFYGPDRYSPPVLTTGWIITYTSNFPVNWNREYHTSIIDFTAPAGSTNALLKIGCDYSSFDIDAVQFEEYDVSGPRPYNESRVNSADRMQAHFIKGDMLEFNSISGDKITANAISGNHIVAGSITTEKLDVVPYYNVILPSGFFDPVSSGLHTIYVASSEMYIGPGTLHTITGVMADAGGSAVGKLFTGGDDNNTYYSYYNYLTSGNIRFSNSMSDAVNSSKSDFIIGQFQNSQTGTTNGGYFIYGGNWAGPGVQINGSQIRAGAVHGNYIQADTISGAHIIAGTISGVKITANTISGNLLAFNTISGENILANTIDISRLKVKSGNLLRNPFFIRNNRTVGGLVTSIYEYAINESDPLVYFTDAYEKLFDNDGIIRLQGGPITVFHSFKITSNYYVPVDYAKTYSAGMWIMWNTNPVPSYRQPRLKINQYDEDYIFISTSNAVNASTVSAGNNIWTFVSGQVPTLDSSTKYITINPYVDYYAAGQYFLTYIAYVGMLVFCEGTVAISSYAPEGVTTIDGGFIEADSIISRHIQAGTISGDRIAANTISGVNIAAQTISGFNITALTISSDKITADAITSAKIAAGAVTTNKLAVKSANLLKDPSLRRYNLSSSQTGLPTNIYNVNSVDNYLTYIDGTAIYWQEDKNSSLFGDGTILTSSNTYDNPGDGSYIYTNYRVPIDTGRDYTASMQIKWNTSASNKTHTPKIGIVFYNALSDGSTVGSEYSLHSDSFTLNNDIWYLASGTIPKETLSTTYSTAKSAVVKFYGEYSINGTNGIQKIYYGFLSLAEGKDALISWSPEGMTVIDGGYIKTGIIDADKITISSQTSAVVINSSGITITSYDSLSLNSHGLISKYRSSVSLSGYLMIHGGDINHIIHSTTNVTGEASFVDKRTDEFYGIRINHINDRIYFGARGYNTRSRPPKVLIRPMKTYTTSIPFAHSITNESFKIAEFAMGGIYNYKTDGDSSVYHGLYASDMTITGTYFKNLGDSLTFFNAIPGETVTLTPATSEYLKTIQYRGDTDYYKQLYHVTTQFYMYNWLSTVTYSDVWIRYAWGKFNGNIFTISGVVDRTYTMHREFFPDMYHKRIYDDVDMLLTVGTGNTISNTLPITETGWSFIIQVYAPAISGQMFCIPYNTYGTHFKYLTDVSTPGLIITGGVVFNLYDATIIE